MTFQDFISSKAGSGVYAIKCTTNGLVYVGSSHSMWERARQHQSDLMCGRHHNRLLQIDFSVFGYDSFDVSVLEECAYGLLERREAWYAKRYVKTAYNLAGVGRNKNFVPGKNRGTTIYARIPIDLADALDNSVRAQRKKTSEIVRDALYMYIKSQALSSN